MHRHADFDLCLKINHLCFVRPTSFIDISEYHALALTIDLGTGHVIQAKDNILRWHDDRIAISRRQNIIRCHHQCARFDLRFDRKRYVYRHLVTVEVCIERRTYERVQLNRLALDQYRFERLDAEPVQCWRTVQHDRMFADDLFEDVPDFCAFALDKTFGRLDSRRLAAQLQFGKNKRLEQFQRHLLRQTALMKFERRSYYDHRTA